MLDLVILLAGFVLLVWGADRFVEGASALAKTMKIPPLIIGLTVVAFGTSAPELTVSSTAGFKGANALAISNVLGSNFFNMLVVIGLCALFTPQVSDKSLQRRDWPFCIVATGVLAAMISFDGVLSRLDAGILLGGFFTVIGIQIYAGIKARQLNDDNEDISDITDPVQIWWRIILGMVAIAGGGEFCVNGATGIAEMMGLTETIIGLTVVALGTSLPELATSVAATKKGESDLAIGNVVGSNLFNLLLILGVSGLLTPIPIANTAVTDVCVLFVVTVVVFFLSKKEQIGRTDGIFMLLSYVAYMTWVVVRELPIAEITAV